MSTTTKLTRGEVRRLVRLASEHEQRAATYRSAGLDDDAEQEQAKAAAIRQRIKEDKRARQEEESRRREAKRRQEEARERREREEEEAKEKAVAFLKSLPLPLEVSEVVTLAEEEGIHRSHLVSAAGELDLRTMGWLKSGTRTLVDRSKGTYWGRPGGVGMIDAGAPRLPSAA